MRSTLEIIIAVQESQPVTEEELRLALLAMSSIHHFIHEDLRSLIDAVEQDKSSAKLRAAFAKATIARMFAASKKSPAEWLGPDNIPGTPAHDQRRAAAKRLYEKATGEKL